MRTGGDGSTTIAALGLQIVGCSLTAVGNLIILKAVIFIPIMLNVLCGLMFILLFLRVHLKFKVLVVQSRSPNLIVKRLELYGLLISDVRLFCSRPFSQTSCE